MTPAFGSMPPIVADRRRKPDRRQVSLRWLSGTLLTAMTSSLLMGVALRAALDDQASVVRPASAAYALVLDTVLEAKGGRVVATALPVASSRQVLELSTMVREGDSEIVRTLPFGYLDMLLGADYPKVGDYPDFDPLTLFSDDHAGGDESDQPRLYGARVGAEVALTTTPFAFDETSYASEEPDTGARSVDLVADVMPRLAYQPIRLASLRPLDPGRFADAPDPSRYVPGSAFRVIEENVSFSSSQDDAGRVRFHEEVLAVREAAEIADVLARAGFAKEDTAAIVDALAASFGETTLAAGDALRVGVEVSGEAESVIRLSAYRGDRHLATVAQTTDGPIEPANPPELSASVSKALDESEAETPMRSDMPRIYDGLYQAAKAYGLTDEMCRELVHIVANEVDLKSRLDPQDRLRVFYTLEEGETSASADSELLYVEMVFGGETRRFYRYRAEDAKAAAYFDPDGRSAERFLMRKPLPRGRFTSGFSTGRRHPVLGYTRPHWGVDWAAPRGTKIMAAGDGVVEEAGWSSGYGRRTVIRHANGYETTYAHQNQIMSGIKPGARVKQGQVIGLVGTTGLSTGNHLHYEVTVNGKRVDPLRIKLAAGQVLKGDDLAAFTRERDRIDDLLAENVEKPILASN